MPDSFREGVGERTPRGTDGLRSQTTGGAICVKTLLKCPLMDSLKMSSWLGAGARSGGRFEGERRATATGF
jgi:hypothetical protein